MLPVELPPIHQPQVPFDDSVIDNEPVKAVVGCYNNGSRFVQAPEPEFSGDDQITDKFMDEDMKIAKEAYEKLKKSRVSNKSVISMPVLTPSNINQVELSLPEQKPPASARFSHRKPAKPTHEGGRTLRVAKPKRQDTLETTWKAITEGRGVPLTRHLRKSDTWETHHQTTHTHSEELPSHDDDDNDNNNHSDNRMKKSETFSGVKSSRKPPAAPSKLNRSGGSGRLRKEPSLGQEELNRRVEAFIKKFNEDMRLQRQESLNQYMEMINRGAH